VGCAGSAVIVPAFEAFQSSVTLSPLQIRRGAA
jgi:hypothetical protein